ncbi:nodulation protein NfeD [Trinickia dinghuensis]|uniref:Nodulation protein NfeD n=1 Tax=Trinickia dinghuensis TaxID=2291023 RepID=A0A3D8JTH8_9BURK|nr:nodulation protein NfeD [Trinickia dinghuensis]
MKTHPLPRIASTRQARPHARLRAWLARCIAALLALAACATAADSSQVGEVAVIPVVGAIGPASADFITRSLARAARDQAQLAVIELDTPGGLDTSMRQIIKAILASPVPVAAFIAPGGARAASAGTYIVYACHVAAMAPGTNLGAATPIQLGGPGIAPPEPKPASGLDKGPASAPATDTQSTETRKQIHDAAAYIRGLAQLRGRNADWAERAVREAVSLSANEALAQHVVDLTARDLPDLLTKLDGRTIETANGAHKLATAHARIVTFEPDWRSHVLAVVTDPNVALILLTIGMYGLFFEFANPGFVLPGVAGVICLLIGLFALQLLPISYTGLALIFLGIAFLIAEAFLPTFGTLGFGGIVAFAAGALMLIDTDQPGYGIPLSTIAAISAAGAVFVFFVSSFAYRARKRPVVSGGEALVGSIGEIIDAALAPVRNEAGNAVGNEPGNAGRDEAQGASIGWARVHGERWRVCAAAPIAAGARVRVTGRHGLTLDVVQAEDPQQRGVSS